MNRKIVQRHIADNHIVDIHNTVSDARDKIGVLTVSNISKCLSGKRASAHGFKWEYLDENEAQTEMEAQQIGDEPEEEWKDIPGFEGKYKVSNKGNVYGVKWKRNLASYLDKGYYYVTLQRSVSNKACRVHELVAIAFVDNPNDYKNVRHIDGNVSHNDADNLEWYS